MLAYMKNGKQSNMISWYLSHFFCIPEKESKRKRVRKPELYEYIGITTNMLDTVNFF